MTVQVLLDSGLRQAFDYSVPLALEKGVAVGTRVRIPFRGRDVTGTVVQHRTASTGSPLREIAGVQDETSLINASVLSLATWMADYYNCPLPTALQSVLPGPVRRSGACHQERLFVRLAGTGGSPKALTRVQERIVALLEERGELPQAEVLEALGTTSATLRRLAESGAISLIKRRQERDPNVGELLIPTSPLLLNAEQSDALRNIIAALSEQSGSQSNVAATPSRERVFLLHGVTGSGKTEVYLQAIAEALRLGGGAIILVPEISLTPQTVERFRARFTTPDTPDWVAVLHSHLSEGERHDEWHKIREGRARIVIGARSAIFAPVANLSLVIVDEEHEHSYKQEEAPRYHARDVAVMRGKIDQAVVILGSATPSLESYSNALGGKYRLLELRHRATEIRMPVVRVVDLRNEQRRAGQSSAVISHPLRDAISLRLERREQTILFLNRRGHSTCLTCERCGHVAGCPNCSVALTYHRTEGRLLCHICGHAEPVPERCPQPQCGNPAIRYSGLGTQRVEEALVKLFPKATVRRLDSDALRKKNDFRTILNDFRTGQIDILLGTQMIAKGLDFPNVTLVGIVNADLGLHLPDFRAGERTFQLLTQVSGRAGRGDVEGEVFIQTFTPFHPAIQFARRHDFIGFYEQEIEFRRQLNYPPFARVALLTIKGRNEEKVRFCAEHVARELNRRTAGWPGLMLTGPAVAPLPRAETFHRYQIMIRTRQMTRLSRMLAQLEVDFRLPEDVRLSADIDPVNLL